MLLLAQENAGVLTRSFVIALVIVSPVIFWQWRRIKARRLAEQETDGLGTAAAGAAAGEAATHGTAHNRAAAHGTAPAGGSETSTGTLEAIIERVGELATSTAPGSEATLEVPVGATLEGRPAAPTLVEPLVRDALNRGGFDVIEVIRGNEPMEVGSDDKTSAADDTPSGDSTSPANNTSPGDSPSAADSDLRSDSTSPGDDTPSGDSPSAPDSDLRSDSTSPGDEAPVTAGAADEVRGLTFRCRRR